MYIFLIKAKEEREKYYFDNEIKVHNENQTLFNVSQIEENKETFEAFQPKNSVLNFELKKKTKKVNNKLEAFLKVPESDTNGKFIQENGSKQIKSIANKTPENGRANKLSDNLTKVDKSTSVSSKKPLLTILPTNQATNEFKIKEDTSLTPSNFQTKEFTPPPQRKDCTPRSKDNSRDTYLDKYKTKKNNSTITDHECNSDNLPK
jgi:hypothetical protein